jgi:hypothetical protein
VCARGGVPHPVPSLSTTLAPQRACQPTETGWAPHSSPGYGLSPRDNPARRLRMLPVSATPLQDPLDGLTHMQPGSPQQRGERHDPMRKQLQHHALGAMSRRLSITKSRRRRGSALGSVIRVVSPSCHRSHCRRFSSADRGSSDSGSAARKGTNSSGIQGCSTVLVPLRVPFIRTAPVTGQQSVINVAIPLRIYSCASGRAFVSICQLPPTEDIV